MTNVEINNYGKILNKKDFKNTEIISIKNNLRMIPKNNFGNFVCKGFNIFKETENFLIVPSFYPIKNEIIKYNFKPTENVFNLNDIIILRPHQKEIIDNILSKIKNETFGGIVHLDTSGGKTIISLKAVVMLKKKTLIFVNRIELLKQWENKIKTFIPNAKIGFIQGKIHDTKNKDIVLAMVHTVSMKQELTAKDFFEYHICIVDEIHNMCAEVFSNIFFKVNTPIKIGLTATPDRKDKMDIIFKYWFGETLKVEHNKISKQYTEIDIISYTNTKTQKELLLYDKITPNISRMMSDMCDDARRTKIIFNCIITEIKNDKRKILVLSDRKQLLYDLKKMIPSASLFTGTDKEDLGSQVILGTYAVCSEGFDLPSLNCVLFATPRGNVKQSIGRIYRQTHSGVNPLIIDILDDFSIFSAMAFKRRRIYKAELKDNFKIKSNDIFTE